MLATFVQIEMWLLLVTLTLIVGYQLLNGQITTRGVLSDKTTGEFSPARLQLLLASLFGAVYYLLQAMDAQSTGRLPDIPEEVLLALGGSNVLYLGAKSVPLLGALRRE
jgi:hypothetical protein